MREDHFAFSPSYTPLNHGSFGAYPRIIQGRQHEFQKLAHERPDTFIVFDLPKLIDESRAAVAPLLGVPVDEVVFVPNATTGINTVLRNLKFERGDVIVHFSTIYSACEKTIASIGETSPVTGVNIPLEYPIEDDEIVRRLSEMVGTLRAEGKNVRVALFDTVLTFPGARMPWEELVKACRELGVLSLIDGAHGIGHIDLTHLGAVAPDFFVSNCHKYVCFKNFPISFSSFLELSEPKGVIRIDLHGSRWLYTPRGCAVFHAPVRNQHLMRTSMPTSHGYQYLSESPDLGDKPPFVHLFEFVATIDYTPYLCIPAALEFRRTVCGGEGKIREYCYQLAQTGGNRVAEILQTEVMDNQSNTIRKCCFANVRLPIAFKIGRDLSSQKGFDVEEAPKIQRWLNTTAVKEFDTYLQIAFVSGHMWVRLSGQVYLELENFEWIAHRLMELCDRIIKGEKFC
jgi:selenocysteine lyase/cysteine desulfurase